MLATSGRFRAPEWDEYQTAFAAALNHEEFRAISIGVRQLQMVHAHARACETSRDVADFELLNHMLATVVRDFRVAQALLLSIATEDLVPFPSRIFRRTRSSSGTRVQIAQSAAERLDTEADAKYRQMASAKVATARKSATGQVEVVPMNSDEGPT